MAEDEPKGSGTVTLLPATAIVVGNMVGTGVFMSLGFQVRDIQSGFVLISLWLIGGVCALCGALCYGELAAAMPRSGGEYHLLSRIYHPSVGFLAGWVSGTVGFAAPIALAAMAFGTYGAGILGAPEEAVRGVALGLSAGLVAIVTGIHLCHIAVGSGFQSLFTSLKVLLIAVLVVSAFAMGTRQEVVFLPARGDGGQFLSKPFAVSLVFVMYAYTGWNAATYVVNEVKNPRVVVPRALLLGTVLVTVLYVALNAAFLYSTPIEAMEGKMEVGLVAARHIFGHYGGNVMASLICFGLISALSAMTWAGPRVTQMMGEDYPVLGWLAKTSRGVPRVAILWQTAIVYLLLFTATFEAVLIYIELLLVLFSFLTVAGLFLVRRRVDLERPLKTWGYPVTPLVFLAVSGWMIAYLVMEKPVETLWGLVTLGVGGVVFVIAARGRGPDAGSE